MSALLICPGERQNVSFLAQVLPLVSVPLLGEPLLGYWLAWLSSSGVKDVTILVTDRPDVVRKTVEDGERWGLRVRLEPELRELEPVQAEAKYLKSPGAGEHSVFVVDHLPGLEEIPLLRSYRDWFAAACRLTAQAASLNRIGLHEVQAGVWCGRRTRVAPTAKLIGPCWLGDNVQVSGEAIVGPNVVLEDGAVIDTAAEVRASVVGPDTFVGALTRVENSIAFGSTLIDWQSGSCTQVPDRFLLCALNRPASEAGPSWPERIFRPLLRPLTLLGELQQKLRRTG